MELCTTSNESPTKACHNCRRSRRRCDRSIPTCNKCHSTGQVCLGYGKFLQWTNSVASRGKMMGKTFERTIASETRLIAPHVNSTSLVSRPKAEFNHNGEKVSHLHSTSSWYLQLDDPTFQDLSKSSKFYLSYYDRQVCKDLVFQDLPKKNPFRDLLPISADHLVLQHIIVANSALHFANAIEKRPFTQDARQGPLIKAYNDALVAKQRGLHLLSEALANNNATYPDVLLASIMLFIKFELLDSGRNGWRFHTEGARQLMVYLRQNGKSELSALNSLRSCLLYNCAVYDIFGTTLTTSSPEDMQNADLLDIASLDIGSLYLEEQANSCLSCPPLLLQVIRDVSRSSQSPSSENLPRKTKDQLLSIVDSFSPNVWANSLQHISLSFDLEMRVHIGSAYKSAVKIYILRAAVFANPVQVILKPLEDLVSEIILHLTFIPPDDPFFKGTCWPSFIAGAETNNLDHRKWVSSRFKTGLQTLPWGFLSSALDILYRIWDQKNEEQGETDWLINLKLSENDWLIA